MGRFARFVRSMLVKKNQNNTRKEAAPLLVVAIDFGTTYSGWAYSFRDEVAQDPPKISTRVWKGGEMHSEKCPTAILINPDGKTTDSFGYEAEEKYSAFCEIGSQADWFFFKRFKMNLYRDQAIDRDLLLEDYTGKKLSALTVFALSMKFLKDDLLKEVKKTLDGIIDTKDIQWVLTVPAIWNDAAKQLMREAATKAGIRDEHLSICLEPEAASIYCSRIPLSITSSSGAENITSLSQFEEGTQFMILDAGGGTVDITVHEKASNGNLKEVYKASGDALGGTNVDTEFEKFLFEILGQFVMTRLRSNLEDYLLLLSRFEIKKRLISGETQDITIQLPPSLCDLSTENPNLLEESIHSKSVSFRPGKLKINAELVKTFFQPAIDAIIKHVQSLLKNVQLRKCSAILMVGGFSTSPLLQEGMNETFPKMKIIIPKEANTAVLKGAVIYGHNSSIITERVCRFTYGTETSHIYLQSCAHKRSTDYDKGGVLVCYDIFKIHAKIGQSVRLDEEQDEIIYHSSYADQSEIKFGMYASVSEEPELVTESGCRKIGEVSIPIRHKSFEIKKRFGVCFIFGGTEIRVKVTDKANGQVHVTSVNCLGLH